MPLSNCYAPPIVDHCLGTEGNNSNGTVDREINNAVGQIGLVSGASGSARWKEGCADAQDL